MRPINYDGKGNVMAYHAVCNQDGSTAEHTAMVDLSTIPNATKSDGTTDPNTILLICPICGARAWVPITGNREAQRLHAMVRAVRGTDAPYNTIAADSVINDVKALGGTPRITPTDNPFVGK